MLVNYEYGKTLKGDTNRKNISERFNSLKNLRMGKNNKRKSIPTTYDDESFSNNSPNLK